MSATVWGWGGSASPTTPHSSPLAVLTLLLSPTGHATAWESTPKPCWCHGGDRGFCSGSCPCSEPGCPQPGCPQPGHPRPGRVGVALLSQAVTGCCFSPRGWSSRLWRVTNISRYHPQLGARARSRGTPRCPAGSQGHAQPTQRGDVATARGGTQGDWAELVGGVARLGGGVWGRAMWVPGGC